MVSKGLVYKLKAKLNSRPPPTWFLEFILSHTVDGEDVDIS